jgi:hypothetical protein
MTIATHEAVFEAAPSRESCTVNGCASDLLFAAGGIVGAVLGAVVGLVYALPYTGGEFGDAVGAVGAMLGSGLFATLCGLTHRHEV